MTKHTPELIQSQLPFDEIQPGYCACGCGGKTWIASITSKKYGWTKGQPVYYIRGHSQILHLPNPNPSGLCFCGCGKLTPIAQMTDTQTGIVKGYPSRFVAGHRMRENLLEDGPNPGGICMCGCGQPAPISSATRKKWGVIKGKPSRFIRGHGGVRSVTERFWEKVDKLTPDECWVWKASKTLGYGTFANEDRSHIMAHRFSYELHNGSIPDSMFVLHKCDNPSCVNPDHLFLGTQQDNMDDMVAKGRSTLGRKYRQRKSIS